MYPWPAIKVGENTLTTASDIEAPPSPPINPENITARYLIFPTEISKVSAAFGCSPTAISLSPHFVLYKNT